MAKTWLNTLWLFFMFGFGAQAQTDIINGEVIPKSARPEVVHLKTEKSFCTATLIGPRTLLTAAHCGRPGQTSKFIWNEEIIEGRFVRSALYSPYKKQSHDIAVVILKNPLKNIRPASLSFEKPELEDLLQHYGYGCTNAKGENSGTLRLGHAEVDGWTTHYMVSSGAGVCFGDSGGPAYYADLETLYLVGVHAQGDIESNNFSTRLDTKISKRFFNAVIKVFEVEICGLTRSCEPLIGASN